jgi:hypothetical protein
MKSDTASGKTNNVEISVYECEINLKFRLIEETFAWRDKDELLDLLIEAFTTGTDEYMEPLQSRVKTQKISDLEASPQMRRQLMRLRNSSEFA